MPRARAALASGTSLRIGEAGICSARSEISGMYTGFCGPDHSISTEGRNLMTLRGGIFTAAPVRGLRPTRSGRCCTLNVPSPVSVSRSPSRRDCTVTRIMASMALRASTFEMFASRAMASTNCALFMASLREKIPFGVLTY